MPSHWPTITLIIALLALWIAFDNWRKSNWVILKIKDCRYTAAQSRDENNCQPYHVFRLLIQNRGITLHDLGASITFLGPDGSGSCDLPLKRLGRTEVGTDEFGRGMIAEFYFKSYELNDGARAFVGLLQDPRRQDARLRVYSQGYLAKTIRIGGWWDRLKARWNVLAAKVNNSTQRRVGTNAEGVPIIRIRKVLPRLTVIGAELMDFIGALAAGSSRSTSDQ